MRDGVRVRDITNEEGNRLLRIVRRSSGSVVTWRRARTGSSRAPRRRRPGHLQASPRGPPPADRLRLSTDRLYGHVKPKKDRTEFLAFCRYIRSLHPAEVRIAIVLDNFSPHLSTKTDPRVGEWTAANSVELVYVPFYASWLNRTEAQFTGLALFRPRRHRSREPPGTGADDPALHRLAESQPPTTRHYVNL